jgi:hypothetical protein
MSKNDEKKLVSLIDENENDNGQESVQLPKKTATVIDVLPTTSKSTLLEVNNMDKYKSFLINKPETQAMKPSEALSRVRQFLPMLKESTDKLLEEYKDKPDELNIENVGEEDEHIEMNVAFVPEGSSDDDEDEDEDEDDDTEEEEDEVESEDELDESSYADQDEQNQIKRKHSNQKEESNSPDPLDELGLGFKYNTKLKLKLNPNDENFKNKKLKKNLIQEVAEDNNNSETKNVENNNNNNSD